MIEEAYVPLVVAVLAAGGALGAAVVTAVGVILGLLWRRITHLEGELHKRQHRIHELWWWALSVRDYYYRYRTPDAPDLPEPPEEENTA